MQNETEEIHLLWEQEAIENQRLARNRERARLYRALEPPEKREARLSYLRERARASRASETLEQYEARLNDMRLRAQARAAKASEQNQPSIQITECVSLSDDYYKQDIETFNYDSMKSATTDRPFITVIKPEDSKIDEQESASSDESDEEISVEKPSANKFNPNALPSPYKHLPSVSVCLKEEDRLIAQKELGKSVKRSSSICSNSSNGSNDVNKPSPTPKRRKVEKPAPTVIGRQNDCYCWICHRENITLCCIACPRAYHQKCSGDFTSMPDWVCPECKRILHAENVDSRSSVLSEISLDKLCSLLKFSLNKMKHRAGVAFHQPVSLEHYPMYPHYVIHSMDFSLLEKNIKQKLYGCTEAFLADVKWILHNSCVFNGTQHPLSTNAKSLVKTCENDMQEIEVCPDCFMHSVIRNKYWFSEVCRKPHPLVWAKLKGFPYWPAKVVRIADGNVDARFFGAHDRAWVPINQCYHLSKEMPTSSKPKKKGNYETALDELNVHVHLLIQKFGTFEYAPYRTTFDIENKLFLYHGIDIDMIDKEEIPFDSSTTISNEFCSSPKETDKSLESKMSYDSFETPSKSVDEEEIDKASSKEAESRSTFNIERQSVSINLFGSKDQNKTESNNELDLKDIAQEKKAPESSKMNAIEKALERIKGYVAVNDDEEDVVEKEVIEDSTKVSEEPKTSNIETKTVKQSGSSFLAGLIKSKPLPSLDIPSIPIEESAEETPVTILDTAKKSDSFSLKLIETIESCKAKLGISGSELNDSIDSESVDDEDEDEEVEEEEEDEEDDEEDEDEEVEEIEEDGYKGREDVRRKKKQSKENLNMSDAEGSDGDSSESEDSDSISSDTDIETVDLDASLGDVQKNLVNDSASVEKHGNEENKTSNDSDDVNKESGDAPPNSNKVHEPNKDKVDNQSNATENITISEPDVAKIVSDEENDHTENEMDVSDSAKNVSENDSTKIVSEDENVHTEHSSDDEKNQTKIVSDHAAKQNEQVDNISKNNQALTSSPQQDKLMSSSPVKTHPSSGSVSIDERSSSIAADGNDEDDDIFICTSPQPRPPTPPLICLDDGTETEPEVEDKSIKNVPKIHSLDNPLSIINESYRQSLNKIDSADCTLSEIVIKPSISSFKLPTNARKSFKRVFKSVSPVESSDDDDDDEIQVVSTASRVPLSGAKRTFINRFQTSTAKKPNITDETSSSTAVVSIDRSSREQTRDKIDDESVLENNVSSDHIAHMELDTSADSINQISIVEPTSPSDDKDEVIAKLKTKLGRLFSTLRLQHWKHNQEKNELRHNLNLIVMEMRASLEADKKQAVETLGRTLEREKIRCIEEAKKKQWCAYCLQESRYACCWNTSYCTYACQKRHFNAHRKFCTQLSVTKPMLADGLETKPIDTKEGKKVLVLNMLPKTEASKSSDSHSPTVQIPLSKVKAPIQLVSSSVAGITSTVQLMFSPLRQDTSPTLQSKPATKENIPDSECAENKVNDSSTASLPKNTSQESSSLFKRSNDRGEETSLEEIYFPSPPTVSFEGLDTALPDENVRFNDLEEDPESYLSETEQPSEDKADESSGEEDLVLSENDETDNELVSLGHGVDLKAKFLNKCLIYGKTAKRLTRCLVDVLFPDIKLLANCSAFGNKSNVTKLTRAALPSRKVGCIIDYVLKRFPDSSKTEIVLAINMKCKEARNIIRKADTDGVMRKPLFRRLLAKEQKQESSSVSLESSKTSTTVNPKVHKVVPKMTKASLVTVAPKITTSTLTTTSTTIKPATSSSAFTILRKAIPNIVCVKNSTSASNSATSAHLIRPKQSPAILQYNSQVPIQPKPFGYKPQTRLLLPPSTNLSAKGSQTVRQLLDNKSVLTRAQGYNTPRDGKKILLPLNFIKKPVNSPDATKAPDLSLNPNKTPQRPCIIIGTKASTTTQSSVSQKSSCSTSTMKRK